MTHRRKAIFVLLASLACDAAKPETARPDEPQAMARSAAPPAVDRERLVAVVRHLASDDMRGRFTLNPADIDRAATFLATAYEQAGIAPVGADYRVAYDVVAGTEPSEDLNVWLEMGPDVRALEAADAIGIANGTGEPVVGDVA